MVLLFHVRDEIILGRIAPRAGYERLRVRRKILRQRPGVCPGRLYGLLLCGDLNAMGRHEGLDIMNGVAD